MVRPTLTRSLAAILMAIMVCASSRGAAEAATPDRLAIRNVSIVDVRTGSLRPGMTVLIEGDSIARIGANLGIPSDATVVDGAGKFLMPGLWDMHVHLHALDPHPRAVENLVAHGVTGVRDMGGYPEAIESLRDSIENGRRVGPRIMRPGPTLNGAQPAGFHRAVATPDEARRVVRELAEDGVDFIKVHNQMAPDVFLAVADEVTKVDLTVVGHVPYGVSLNEACDAGMRSVEHAEVLVETEIHQLHDPANGLADAFGRLEGDRGKQVFECFAKKGIVLVPTLTAYSSFVESQPDERSRKMGDRMLASLKKLIGRAYRLGVTVLAGTDGGDTDSDPGERLHRELVLLVEAGLSTVDALRAATILPAKFMELTRQGVVAEGYAADLVLLAANPLEDIKNVAQIDSVVLRGKFLDNQVLERMRSRGGGSATE